ncbi:MAG: hypothetical protein J0L75_02200 [Spirochaetes bacterium]|nr:hypothetical protein [Spirochaetota bacterium]
MKLSLKASLVALLLATATANLSAADAGLLNMSEAEMFGGSNKIEVDIRTNGGGLVSNVYPQVKFGGNLHAWANWGIRRPWENQTYQWESNTVQAYMQGDLNLEVRVASGFKVFTEMSLAYSPTGLPDKATMQPKWEWKAQTNQVLIGSTENGVFSTPVYTNIVITNYVQVWNTNISSNNLLLSMKEFFADFNIGQVLYWRLGKQVLTWGRGYFWQPTDLINIEKFNVVNRDLLREGTYGLRLHIPYKTYFNLYSFLNLGSTPDFKKYAVSVKAEGRVGPLELAVSYLGRPYRLPVWGADFSVGARGWNFYGEAMYALEGQNDLLKTANVTTNFIPWLQTNLVLPQVYRLSNDYLKACIGVSKSFGRENKWMFGFEGYYNGEGYTNSGGLSESNLQPLFQYGGFLRSMEHGQWYTAAYLTRSELFNKTTTLSLTGVANWSDWSGLLSFSATYSPIDYFTVSLRLPFYIGDSNREFTFQNQLAPVQLELAYRF